MRSKCLFISSEDGCREYIWEESIVEIHQGQTHRVINDNDTHNLQILEIQKGDKLDEDDIIRLEDDYGRIDHDKN